MKIDLLCGDLNHPVVPYLRSWVVEQDAYQHQVEILTKKENLTGGDILLMISYPELVGPSIRNLYKKCLVMHASDLPAGKGWSPHIWQVLEGKKEIVVTLFEAVNKVDAGDIWNKLSFTLEGHETYDEINHLLCSTELRLMTWAVDNFSSVVPLPQSTSGESFYPRRSPENSRIDVDKSLAEQFDLLRVCDPFRYPAYFEYRGHKYELILRKVPARLIAKGDTN